MHDTERGPALETWILHELRAHLAHGGLGGELAYYRTPAGVEVDFVWTGPRHAVGIEVKAAGRWRPADGHGLRDLYDRGVIRCAIGVYGGARAQKDGPITVLPVRAFIERLPALIPG